MDKDTKQMFELIIGKLDGMDKRLDGMDKRFDGIEGRLAIVEKRQDEMYLMQRALEENVKAIRKGQEKLLYMFSDIQEKMSKIIQ